MVQQLWTVKIKIDFLFRSKFFIASIVSDLLNLVVINSTKRETAATFVLTKLRLEKKPYLLQQKKYIYLSHVEMRKKPSWGLKKENKSVKEI